MRDYAPQTLHEMLIQALGHTESRRLEAKRVSGKMVGKALETVCAFANTQGGWLMLGVEDHDKAKGIKRLIGIGENPEAVDELQRKLVTQFVPAIDNIGVYRVATRLASDEDGEVLLIEVPVSDKVHSIIDGGTWTRGNASNRLMTASEITELAYRRGVRSAESEPVDIDFELLATDAWRTFLIGRGLTHGDQADQLYRLGLAKRIGDKLQPLRAAVLLFADEPGSLLAGVGTRADVRVFHYVGNAVQAGEVPNLKKPPKTISGPLYRQIAATHAYVLDELAGGLTLAASGFKTVHRYPERVIKEAITNAIIHRDYRLNRDVQIRIFDNRIEVLSPGLLPGRITPQSIARTGSFARNPLIAKNLREFPEPPNVDAGEGVPMMFTLMRANELYPPFYRELSGEVAGIVSVTLLNESRPPIWEQVSDWIDRNGPIANADLCQIANVDTLKASRMLKAWVSQGVLESMAGRAKRNMAYRKPASSDEEPSLFSNDNDKKSDP